MKRSTIRVRAGLTAALAAGILLVSTIAGAEGASAATSGARLPDSDTLTAYATPFDYSDTTRPEVVCPASETGGCVVESDGTVSSVRIGLFALTSANARIAELHGRVSSTTFGVFDASGRQVGTAPGLSCSEIAWQPGQYVLCANTTPNFRVTIPAGGRLAPAADTGLFGVFIDASTGAWPIGHDFADKNHPQTTVYDRAIVTYRAAGSFGVSGPTAYTYAAAAPAGSKATVTQDEDLAAARTTTTLTVSGLLPNRTYDAHLHVSACGATGAAAGGHYQNSPSSDPRAVNPANEIWLGFTTDATGAASATSRVDWIAREGEGNSVVIHDAAGARVACLTLGK